jgi:hypothetical protein
VRKKQPITADALQQLQYHGAITSKRCL